MENNKINLWQRAKDDPLTTIIGLAGGAYMVLCPTLQQGRVPTTSEWIMAGFMALLGIAATGNRQ
ncbi:MAG: hypothetical protein A4E65_00812 [Syntrophorhabdus sp. PtaU1.Bin153]|nr:MAG: hypothetical protein A4E65_00812 [Syntrophorhabdus sp. PtaU1.Bin153]